MNSRPYYGYSQKSKFVKQKMGILNVFLEKLMECNCGSNKERYELIDARGIFVSFVCNDCIEEAKSHS